MLELEFNPKNRSLVQWKPHYIGAAVKTDYLFFTGVIFLSPLMSYVKSIVL